MYILAGLHQTHLIVEKGSNSDMNQLMEFHNGHIELEHAVANTMTWGEASTRISQLQMD